VQCPVLDVVILLVIAYRLHRVAGRTLCFYILYVSIDV